MDRVWDAESQSNRLLNASAMSSTVFASLLLRQVPYTSTTQELPNVPGLQVGGARCRTFDDAATFATQFPTHDLAVFPSAQGTTWDAEEVYNMLSADFFPAPLLPSMSRNAAGFDPRRAMNGPAWLRLNVLVWDAVGTVRHEAPHPIVVCGR